MRLWGLKNCDTCRKAMKELRAAGYAVTLVDVRADGIETSDLERFFETFGDEIVNRRSTTWRGLSDDERAGAPVAQILAHPALMKRPVIEGGEKMTLGWGQETRTLWLDNAG
ncbi:ArsC/Spx/MgsR family protein [Aliiroseovarius subalbicans]|uniref:arsenate reductase family protein n=1 Tax=Aliiroseovarius subalbicans TaxID=2925840 RepID=UPI001F55ABAE|nr:ArsC/Spx/MgsR family protein [Aliiroseovarius subalbicans]MCI2397880.1 arsenate reductase [Aliiroseovarius subalbicans]